MKDFLKKYLTEEQIAMVKQKYIAENEGAEDLPVYVPKSRFDEVNTKKGAAEAQLSTLKEQHEQALKTAKTEWEKEFNKTKETEVNALKTDFSIVEAIYKAKGRNVKAIKALIDPTKKPEEELARLQKDEAYLFESDKEDLPKGTGKEKPAKEDNADAEMKAMRAAVGL